MLEHPGQSPDPVGALATFSFPLGMSGGAMILGPVATAMALPRASSMVVGRIVVMYVEVEVQSNQSCIGKHMGNDRVRSIAVVHQSLIQSDPNKVISGPNPVMSSPQSSLPSSTICFFFLGFSPFSFMALSLSF